MAGNITVNNVQLGDSGTATNNFVLRTNANGTATLARGNVGSTTQDILTIDAAGRVVAPFSRFTSTEQTVTSAGSLTIAHGLGAVPWAVHAFLVCKTAEAGYAVNDVVPVDIHTIGWNSNNGQAITYDSTNLYVRFGATATAYQLLNKTTGSLVSVTNVNWRLVLKAEV